MAQVNFYAAARQAAGSPALLISAGSLGELLQQLSGMNPELAKLIPTCSYLINGTSHNDKNAPLNENDAVDILPQFAGG